MKILILNWRDIKNHKSGGAEVVTMKHLEAWAKAGHEVTWLTSRFPGSASEKVINGVHIIRRGNSISIYLIAPFFYIFAKKKYDLVIDQIHGLPFFTPLYVKEPKIAFIHEVAGEIWDYMYPFPINVIGKWLEHLYFPLYKKVPFWTDAPSTYEDLERFGISKKDFHPILCPAENPPLSKMPVKEKKPTFLFVSRLVKMKGIERVIAAFSEIVRDLPDAQLWLIGGGEESYVQKLQEEIQRHGLEKQVVFWGFVPRQKKLELMSKAHILLHASIKEGWGLVVIEAASQATPAVVYNVAGLKDSVRHGETGIVIKNNKPEEMGKQAVKLYNDKKRYKKFQKNCLKWAGSLKWDEIVQESIQLINKTVREKN
jgi:glycosyltransferase involved in cell wall biosynthesis